MIWHAITAARMLYAQFWEESEVPTQEQWITKIFNLMEMDRLAKSLENQGSNTFKYEWQKFKEYLEKFLKMKGN